jgi:hypothetical protein
VGKRPHNTYQFLKALRPAQAKLFVEAANISFSNTGNHNLHQGCSVEWDNVFDDDDGMKDFEWLCAHVSEEECIELLEKATDVVAKELWEAEEYEYSDEGIKEYLEECCTFDAEGEQV